MIERVRNLDAVGRATAVVVALIVLVGALLAVSTLSGGDDGEAQVDTAASSTTQRSTTSTSVDGSTTTVEDLAATTTTAATGTDGTTATTKPKGGTTGTTAASPGTTPATQPPVTQPPVTQPPVTQPPVTQPSGSCTAASMGNESDRLATLFCNYRANNGLAKMVRTSALNAMAQEWANKLASDHALSHRASADMRARTLAACSACNGWAENVAFVQPVDADGLWQNWLSSPTHLANIRDGHAGEYGMAIAKLPDGSLWAVQNFGRYP